MPTLNLFFVIQALVKYKWYILGLLAAVVILSIIFTMPALYAPQYAAKTIIYPASSERYDVANLFHNEPNVYLYGSPKESERLLNLANSETVALFLLDSLKLWEVYGIDKNDKGNSPRFKALKTLKGNLNVVQVEGGGVSIEAYDIDPDRAAKMANLVSYKINEMNKEMFIKNRSAILEIYQADLKALYKTYAAYMDSSRMVRREYNVYSYTEQTQVMVEQYLIAQGKYEEAKAKYEIFSKTLPSTDTAVMNAKARMIGAEKQMKSMTNGQSEMNLPKFREGIDEVISMEQNGFRLIEKIQILKEKIAGIHTMNNMNYETIMSTEAAFPSDRKARPVRWVIILASALITLLVCIFGTVLIELVVPNLKNKA